MADANVAKREKMATTSAQAPETVYAPDVDIWEDAHGLRLLADMPGVDQKSVDVTVENNVLTIEGRAHVEVPEGCSLVGQEYGASRYHREFTLSDAIDAGSVKALMKQGVLEVHLPKKEEVKARKIPITSG